LPGEIELGWDPLRFLDRLWVLLSLVERGRLS
jgi:hypothetical protein